MIKFYCQENNELFNLFVCMCNEIHIKSFYQKRSKNYDFYSMHTYKSRGYLYWSEGITDAMYRSNMDGSNIELLLNTSVDVIGKQTNLYNL